MKNPSQQEGKRWIAEARRELDAAQTLRDSEHYNFACFHAQQAAEKATKAFLYSRGVENVWGHSVATLLDDAINYKKDLESLRSGGASLDTFYIPTRYPNGLPGGLPSEAYTSEEADRAIKKASNITETIARHL
ncbi:MAG: HEPN domain-containing protein [Candidatus Brocadiia bacterium]